MPPEILAPAPRPCGSCPYRLDVPSGVWSREEYEKLPAFDGETWEQPPSVFLCHQQDGRLCAGWVACHDMDESFGLRVVGAMGHASREVVEAALDYRTDVPLHPSGAAAAAHGLRDLDAPPPEAVRAIGKLERRRVASVRRRR